MKKLIALLLLFPVLAYSQAKRTVAVLPSKDTTLVEFTSTVSQTITTKTTTKPGKLPAVIHDTLYITKIVRDTIKLPCDTVKHPIVVPPVDNSGYLLVFESGFDKTSDITTNSGQYGDGKISTTVYKTAPGSFYSIPQNISSGIRSEVQYTYDYQLISEGAIEYDVMYEVIAQSNCHSVQWHPNTSGASASPGLWHIGGKFTVVRYRNGGNDQQQTAADGSQLMTIPKGKWLHMRWEFKFAQSQAYCRLYIDGLLYYDLKPSSSSWLGDGSGQYLKVGFNGFGTDSYQSRIYYDNLKMYKKN